MGSNTSILSFKLDNETKKKFSDVGHHNVGRYGSVRDKDGKRTAHSV